MKQPPKDCVEESCGLQRVLEQDLIDLVEQELRTRGWSCFERNTTYTKGEIDLRAQRHHYVAVVECKQRDTKSARKEATAQLYRVAETCYPRERVFLLYAYREADTARVQWIPRHYLNAKPERKH